MELIQEQKRGFWFVFILVISRTDCLKLVLMFQVKLHGVLKMQYAEQEKLNCVT